MHDTRTQRPQARLTLHSRLSELAKVWPWVDGLAAEYGIREDTLFAVHLCLEEALSNVIRHGYRGEPDHVVELSFESGRTNDIAFIIEDSAPHFPPDEAERARRASSEIENTAFVDILPGGHGLKLMRKFAGSLNWERLPGGNRLIIRFPAPAAG